MADEAVRTTVKLHLLSFLGIIGICANASAQMVTDWNYGVLRDTRPKITYPEYDRAQKQTMLGQVRMVLDDVFTHRDSKLSHHGPESDHRPRLDDIAARLDALSTSQFHAELSRAVIKLQDYHTSYQYPKPHACYRSFLVMNFQQVDGPGNSTAIAVKAVIDKPEILGLLNGSPGVKVGDILLKVDGVPVEDVIAANKDLSAGANPEAILLGAISQISSVSQRGFAVPTRDTVDLELQNAAGEVYALTTPWLTKADKECLEETTTPPATTAVGLDLDQIEFNRIYRPLRKKKNKSAAGSWIDTAEPIIKYRLIDNALGRFGVLRLESFVTEALGIEDAVSLVKGLLQNELAGTKGLIIDLRSNGGGYIQFAEALVQLFTPQDVRPLLFRLRNTPANYHIVKLWGESNLFAQSLARLQGTSNQFSDAIPFYDDYVVNGVAQFYFAPVAVFTNASCYSSCDMFSAQMQDHGAAVIVGEDSTTGAGGANNTNYNSYTIQLMPVLEMPVPDRGPWLELPAKQNIGFSLRQSLRRAPRMGQLIEDVGVLSDLQVKPTLRDLTTESADQYLAISRKLADMIPQRSSWVRPDRESFDIELGQAPLVRARWQGIDRFNVSSQDGDLGDITVDPDRVEGDAIALPASIDTTRIQNAKIQLIGFKGDERVARKLLDYRVVPASLNILPAQTWGIDFQNSTLSPLALYGDSRDTSTGWQHTPQGLRLGDGLLYRSGLNATASLFAKLPAEHKLSLQLEFDVSSEEGYDMFSVSIKGETQTRVLQTGLSGEVPMLVRTYDLSGFEGERVEIQLRFISDQGVEGRGVTVKKFELVPVARK